MDCIASLEVELECDVDVNTIFVDFGMRLYKVAYADCRHVHGNCEMKPGTVVTCRTFKYTDHSGGYVLESVATVVQQIVQTRLASMMTTNDNTVLVLAGRRAVSFQGTLKLLGQVELCTRSDIELGGIGMAYLIESGQMKASFTWPEYSIAAPQISNSIIDNLKKCWEKKKTAEADDLSIYPLLYISVGHDTRAGVVLNKNEVKDLKNQMLGGRVLCGLGKTLCDTNDYLELTTRASRGDRRNVDTQICDVLEDCDNGPYGKFHPCMPVFSFGKAMDNKLNVVSENDLAASLVAMCLVEVMMSGLQLFLAMSCRSVYYGGNMLQHEIFRIEKSRWNERIPPMMENVFVKEGIEVVLGMKISKYKY